MRGIHIDERDHTWERHDPRFRIYVFDGPDNATTTMDILDASVEEAIDSALALSGGDERLWSLALIDDHSQASRGLVWLSGMDYTETPVTARHWQQRRQMQDRYLLARVRRGLDATLPNGLRLIRLFPEWGTTWPLWESFSDEYNLTPSHLGLSRSLSEALFEWNQSWQGRDEDVPVPARWTEAGQHLARSLQSELGGIAEVRPEFLG